MSARSARRPLPALIFLVALAVLAVLVWVRVSQRDSTAQSAELPVCSSGAPGQLPANSAITINLLNGNGASGLADQTLQAFVAAGFVGGEVGNATTDDGTLTTIDGIATITAGAQGADAAKVVAYYLPGATVSTDESLSGATVSVTIGSQFTALATADAVQAAMAQAQVTQSAAPPPTDSAAGDTPGASSSATDSPTPSPTCRTESAS